MSPAVVAGGATTGGPVRVLLADDQALLRMGFRLVLEAEEGLEVVGEAADGDAAVRQAVALRPDVVLMDVRMPGMSGIEAARCIRQGTPSTRVVMLTSSDEEDDLYGAIRAGANGYLLKDSSLDDVARAVLGVARGESLISPSMASKLLSEFTNLTGEPTPESGGPKLSDREREVLKLVAQGLTNREAASALHLSENTVKNHVANILDKLHLRSRLEAAMYAMRTKMFEL